MFAHHLPSTLPLPCPDKDHQFTDMKRKLEDMERKLIEWENK